MGLEIIAFSICYLSFLYRDFIFPVHKVSQLCLPRQLNGLPLLAVAVLLHEQSDRLVSLEADVDVDMDADMDIDMVVDEDGVADEGPVGELTPDA